MKNELNSINISLYLEDWKDMFAGLKGYLKGHGMERYECYVSPCKRYTLSTVMEYNVDTNSSDVVWKLHEDNERFESVGTHNVRYVEEVIEIMNRPQD